MLSMIEIEDLYTRDNSGKFHIITISNGIFDISPRTTGTSVHNQKLKKLTIIDKSITLTNEDDISYTYSLL